MSHAGTIGHGMGPYGFMCSQCRTEKERELDALLSRPR